MSELEKNKKALKKTQLGKKRILGKENIELKELNEEIIIVGNKENNSQKDNSSSFLLKLILKAFYLSVWKKKVKALKYYSRKVNKQRMNFKKFITEISKVINKQKSDYFNEIILKIDKMILPKNIKHDKLFGTLKIVNKDFLKQNNSNYNNLEKDINQYINSNLMVDKKGKKELKIKSNTETNNNQDFMYDEGSKEMNLNNNDFNENEYTTYDNLDIDNMVFNYNHNHNYENHNYNENEIEEDEAFIENEFDYKQEILNDENNYDINNNEYYQVENYYNYPDYNDYSGNNICNDNLYISNNNMNYIYDDLYYENQYNYYDQPNNEKKLYSYNNEGYYEPSNRVNYIKNTGNNVLISDVYVKPKINSNHNQYFYNKYNYGYQTEIYRGKTNNRRAFPTSNHNHVFYVSK